MKENVTSVIVKAHSFFHGRTDVYGSGKGSRGCQKNIGQKKSLKPTTREGYIYTYDHFVRDSFGNMKLGKVKYSHVKKFYNELLEERGLSIATLDNVNTDLHPAFQMAVRDGLIRVNPTEAGNRTIPLISEVYDAMLREYRVQKVTGFNTSVIDGYSGFIFTNADGTVFEPNAINRAIKRIIRDYNKAEISLAATEGRNPVLLPDFSNHTLRHTFCTRLCENETNIKVIQSIMGHSDIQTTLDIYAECTAEKKQEVLMSLEGKIIVR